MTLPVSLQEAAILSLAYNFTMSDEPEAASSDNNVSADDPQHEAQAEASAAVAAAEKKRFDVKKVSN